MRAAVISAFGPPSVLNVREVDDPVPGADEVLIRVHASALNRADILQRLGKYPPPPGVPTDIGGIEFAGEVTALGPGATRWRAGDRVYGIAGGGAHAEAIRVHQDTIARTFPPSVTIKDYTSGGATGYLNPKPGAQPERFPTIIQIVPAPR